MHNKFRRGSGDVDEEEECWFDRDDEEVDNIDPALEDCYKFDSNLADDLPSKKNTAKLGELRLLLNRL